MGIWIQSQVLVVHASVNPPIVNHVPQAFGDVHEVTLAAVVGTHDVQTPFAVVVPSIGIEFQVDHALFWESVLLSVSVPMMDANDQVLGAAGRGIDAEHLTSSFKLQDSVMQHRAD